MSAHELGDHGAESFPRVFLQEVACSRDNRMLQAGLSLRETTLVIFGNPAAGTPVMAAAPLAALDLPLKILVWQDDDGAVWMTHLDPAWLAARYGLAQELTAPLGEIGRAHV